MQKHPQQAEPIKVLVSASLWKFRVDDEIKVSVRTSFKPHQTCDDDLCSVQLRTNKVCVQKPAEN